MYQISETPTIYPAKKRPGITHPHQAADLLAKNCLDGREAFQALFLDTRHACIVPPYVVSVGSLNASLVHPREVFRQAIALGAVAVILGHNHPSGNLQPSGDDCELTDRLVKAGELIGIAVLDHLILDGAGGFLSMRENGNF